MRAIDGDALMAKLGIGQDCSVCKHDDTPYCCWKPDVVDVCEAICDAPTIEPQRKKGKWIYGESEAGNDGYYCSKCGNFVPWKYDEYDIDFIKEFLFCNKCGAEMGVTNETM